MWLVYLIDVYLVGEVHPDQGTKRLDLKRRAWDAADGSLPSLECRSASVSEGRQKLLELKE